MKSIDKREKKCICFILLASVYLFFILLFIKVLANFKRNQAKYIEFLVNFQCQSEDIPILMNHW